MGQKKLSIYGIGNEKNFNHYTFDKTKEVHKILREVFKEVLEIDWCIEVEEEDKNGEYKVIKIDISKKRDFHEIVGGITNYGKDKGKRIDVFYGYKRMFITLHCSLKERKKINEMLKKRFKFPKVNEFKCQTKKLK